MLAFSLWLCYLYYVTYDRLCVRVSSIVLPPNYIPWYYCNLSLFNLIFFNIYFIILFPYVFCLD